MQNSGLKGRATMSLIRHVGKIMNSLPPAIEEVLEKVKFNSDAPPLRHLTEDEGEFDEHEDEEGLGEDQPQGHPASGTPPGTPPPLDPAEQSVPMPFSLMQRACMGTPLVDQQIPPNLPRTGW